MATRLVRVENAEQLLEFWKAGMLLFCMESNDQAEDPSTYKPVTEHWTTRTLLHEYNTEDSWKKNEWRIRLED